MNATVQKVVGKTSQKGNPYRLVYLIGREDAVFCNDPTVFLEAGKTYDMVLETSKSKDGTKTFTNIVEINSVNQAFIDEGKKPTPTPTPPVQVTTTDQRITRMACIKSACELAKAVAESESNLPAEQRSKIAPDWIQRAAMSFEQWVNR